MADRGRNPTVVIADDDPLIRAVLRAAMVGDGYTVVEAEDGPQAVSVVTSSSPGLVILDARMPGSSLADTFAQTRARAPGVPILILSGQPDPPPEASTEGCAFLSKPVTLSDLRAAVDALTGSDRP